MGFGPPPTPLSAACSGHRLGVGFNIYPLTVPRLVSFVQLIARDKVYI